MIELLFVACLSGSPGECEERRLRYDDMSLTACLVAAQPELARWNEEHPRFHVAKWRCRRVSEDEFDT